MNRKGIVALTIFPFLIFGTNSSDALEIFKPRIKDPGRYDALCAVGGRFDLCDVFLENKELNVISIDGARALDICHEKARIGFRSNPASPYKRVSKTTGSLEKIARKEKGIDHDFLVAVPKPNSVRRETVIIRFKNHKVAIDFGQSVDTSLSTCALSMD